MLRSLVLILLLVNTGFFAWSHGWLNGIVGVQPEAQHEPQRLQREVQADKLVVLGAPSVNPGVRIDRSGPGADACQRHASRCRSQR